MICKAIWNQFAFIYLRIKKCSLPQQACSLNFTTGRAQSSSCSVSSWKGNLSSIPQGINPLSKEALCQRCNHWWGWWGSLPSAVYYPVDVCFRQSQGLWSFSLGPLSIFFFNVVALHRGFEEAEMIKSLPQDPISEFPRREWLQSRAPQSHDLFAACNPL